MKEEEEEEPPNGRNMASATHVIEPEDVLDNEEQVRHTHKYQAAAHFDSAVQVSLLNPELFIDR